jgi:hypothetical protein
MPGEGSLLPIELRGRVGPEPFWEFRKKKALLFPPAANRISITLLTYFSLVTVITELPDPVCSFRVNIFQFYNFILFFILR